ncbi:serine/threonine protein kinase [Micromonospora pisi]|uniref:non-specific serine/threonine protein kinase n=1 Tax=Micromonospora pisi TaxID=589240 RepID=A0A495JL53_9ACTN|nr:serine/threonine protein kinase [Micromonospora pisi]RKR89074.1 serine/threonine protein kinase [Micromonospora pisi]
MGEKLPRHITDRYVLVERIGQGGMGRVWRARDEMLQRDVAVKEIVPPPGLTDQARAELRERSLREARAIARLSHPNAVQVFDVLTSDGEPWIVMEYIPSRSLDAAINTEGPLSPIRAAKIGLGVLGALRAAHQSGIMHRDVKPANILLADDGRIVLTDFGLATAVEDTNLTLSGVVLGSPAYVAPERAMSGIVGVEGDLWSLGATLFAAVEGRSPYARPSSLMSLTALATEPPPVAERAGPLAPVLEGLLRKDPVERMDVESTERLLRDILQEPPNEPPKVGWTEPEYGRQRPRPALSFVMAPGLSQSPTPGRDEESATAAPPAVEATDTGWSGDTGRADSAGSTESGGWPGGFGTTADSGAGPDADTGAEAEAGWNAEEVTPATRIRNARRVWLVGALAAVVLLGIAVAVPLVNREQSAAMSSDSSEPGAAGTDQVTPPTSPGSTPAATGGPLPALTWSSHRDSAGFTVPVPNGWRIQREGARVEFREPTGQRLLAITPTTSPKPDPLAELTSRERSRPTDGQFQGYQRIALASADYYLGAADWEWTYRTNTKDVIHVRQRDVITGKQQGYTIFWATPDSGWKASESAFQRIVTGFRPAPTSTPTATPESTKPRVDPSVKPSTTPNLPRYQLVGVASNRCLDISNPVSVSPVRLRIWDCGARGDRNQSWSFPADGTVRLLDRCMEVANGSRENAAVIQWATCTGGAAQRFTLNAQQQLVNVGSGKCLDVQDMVNDNGGVLQQFTCNNGALHQKWKRV